MRLTETFQEITLQEALLLASERIGQLLHTDDRDRLLVAVFADGLEIAWKSECAGPYSEDTPDLDWDKPTVLARQVSCHQNGE